MSSFTIITIIIIIITIIMFLWTFAVWNKIRLIDWFKVKKYKNNKIRWLFKMR